MASLPVNTSLNTYIPRLNSTRSQKFTQTHPAYLPENGKPYPTLYKSYFKQISSLSKDGEIQEAVDLLNEMQSNNFQIGPEICAELLQGCVYERDLFLGQQLHAWIIKNGESFSRNEFVETKLVIFYSKCSLFEAAACLFGRIRKQNVFSWAAIIGMSCRMGYSERALLGFCEMQETGILADNFVVPNVLKACGALQLVGFGKGVHGYVLKMGFSECVFVASSLVDMYGKCGVLDEARKKFDKMPERNVVAWNSMIASYVQNGMNEEAMETFHDMRVEGMEPTYVTVSSFLSASANLNALVEGKQGHAIATVNGFDLDNILGSSIINFYGKVGLIEDANLVFRRMVEKDAVTWNLIISSHVQHDLVERALNMCRQMRLENFRFDSVTLVSVLSASANTTDLTLGQAGHCYCIRNNLESDVVVASSIVNMYGKCGKILDARRVFDSTKKRDLVLWNTLLAAYAEKGLSGETLKLFYQMQLESVPPNVISWNSVVLGFMRSGDVEKAKEMFSQMKCNGFQPNLVTWTTLITGMAQNGFSDKAILLFQQMTKEGNVPNAVSIVGALSACSNTASLHVGRAIHAFIIRHSMFLSIPLATALVDMYGKCGCIDQAKKVFDTVSRKELPLYNALISAYALHGQAEEALALFELLREEEIEPDHLTFTSILSACSHSGLVEKGFKLFGDMISKYKVQPSIEHYGCLVSLLSRQGKLDEALTLILRMPFHPDEHILTSLLPACREKEELEIGKHISNMLFKLEPDYYGNFVALSKTYASAGKWDEVSRVRELMKEKGMTKNPGCSWIRIGGELHVFVAGDVSHLKTKEIHYMLALLGKEMQLKQYVQLIRNHEIMCH